MKCPVLCCKEDGVNRIFKTIFSVASNADSRMNTPSETSKPVKMESGDGDTGKNKIMV